MSDAQALLKAMQIFDTVKSITTAQNPHANEAEIDQLTTAAMNALFGIKRKGEQ
jgi:hypothetical protein